MADPKTRVTLDGLQAKDFSVDQQGNVTINNDALAKALKDKFQAPGAAPGAVFPGGPDAFVRVAVDVG
jgi:hypothetical protein